MGIRHRYIFREAALGRYLLFSIVDPERPYVGVFLPLATSAQSSSWHTAPGDFRVTPTYVEWARDDAATVGSSSFFAHIETAAGERPALYAIREASGEPPELMAGKLGQDTWVPVSRFNEGVLDDLAGYPEVEDVEWEGADGETIRGMLVVPPDVETPLPLIVNVHGGPTYGWKHAFDPGSSLPLVGAGYATLLPNYRGSTGRGQAYTQLNVGDPGGKEFEDVTRGVAYCVEQGIAEAGRIGIMGASYGGYMTAWAVATSSVFSAAVMISGISDLLSCFHTCNNPLYILTSTNIH